MGRHRAQLTRGDLLARYATAVHCTFDYAHDVHGATEIDQLREIVETYEADRGAFPQRRSFARSLPTTSVQGITR